MARVVDQDVRFGVSTDEGDGDEWQQLRERMLAADILVIVTPIWLGQPSAVCKMVLERRDGELSETDDDGRRSEERRVGQACVRRCNTRWLQEPEKKKKKK